MPVVEHINSLEAETRALSNDELRMKTDVFRKRLKAGCSLDELLPEAFAVVREASNRVLGLRPYDVQLLGGLVLHGGCIAEMGTGEGKTLVAALPAYLNALSGKGVHIVTVNDYLAARDAGWVGKVFKFLGLSVGVVHGSSVAKGASLRAADRAALACDITYATAQELAFCYLYDQLAMEPESVVFTRPFNYTIVDEADFVLIDQCDQPSIISAPFPFDDSSTRIKTATEVARKLYDEENEALARLGGLDAGKHTPSYYYMADKRKKVVMLTGRGEVCAIQLLRERGVELGGHDKSSGAVPTNAHPPSHTLWSGDLPWGPAILKALQVVEFYQQGVDYLVIGNTVVIVDDATGRVHDRQRWEDHQYFEAKEGVPVAKRCYESSSVTFQMFFGLYDKLAGMTGTAEEASRELYDMYGVEVVQVPPHRPRLRVDHPLQLYLNERDKHRELLLLVFDSRSRQQPVLIGSASCEGSDKLSELLQAYKIEHMLLDARPEHVMREARTVAFAGLPGAVTIATNMAGRGTDVLLGGNSKHLARYALAYLLSRRSPVVISEEEYREYNKDNVAYVTFYQNFREPVECLQRDRQVERLLQDVAAAMPDHQTAGWEMIKVKDEEHSGIVRVSGEAYERVLDQSLEMAEECRAQLLLSLRGSSVALTAEVTQAFLDAFDWGNLTGGDDSPLTRGLASLALHHWVVFDQHTAQLAQKVRDAGGLRVICTALMSSKRIEQQLMGRAGRQGDPGESMRVLCMNDVAAWSSLADKILNGAFQMLDTYDTFAFDSMTAELAVGQLQKDKELMSIGARGLWYQADKVIHPMRQHVYNIRKLILFGTPLLRLQLLHSQFLEYADDMVREYVDARRPPTGPSGWRWEELQRAVEGMVNPREEEPITAQLCRMLHDSLVNPDFHIPRLFVRGPMRDWGPLLAERRELPLPPGFRVTMRTRINMAAMLRRQVGSQQLDPLPGFSGRYAADAAVLRDHLAVFLVAAYEVKKDIIYKCLLSNSSEVLVPVSVEHTWDAMERELMLSVMDKAWADFMRDSRNLISAVQLRTYSCCQPWDEFRIDTTSAFETCLHTIRKLQPRAVFIGPLLPAELKPAVLFDRFIKSQGVVQLNPGTREGGDTVAGGVPSPQGTAEEGGVAALQGTGDAGGTAEGGVLIPRRTKDNGALPRAVHIPRVNTEANDNAATARAADVVEGPESDGLPVADTDVGVATTRSAAPVEGRTCNGVPVGDAVDDVAAAQRVAVLDRAEGNGVPIDVGAACHRFLVGDGVADGQRSSRLLLGGAADIHAGCGVVAEGGAQGTRDDSGAGVVGGAVVPFHSGTASSNGVSSPVQPIPAYSLMPDSLDLRGRTAPKPACVELGLPMVDKQPGEVHTWATPWTAASSCGQQAGLPSSNGVADERHQIFRSGAVEPVGSPGTSSHDLYLHINLADQDVSSPRLPHRTRHQLDWEI